MIIHAFIKNSHISRVAEISAEIEKSVPGNLGVKIRGNVITLDCGSAVNFSEAEVIVKENPGVAFVQRESLWPAVAYDQRITPEGHNARFGGGSYGIFESP
ncbi:MAG: hypothetical protein P4L62_02560 [Candidatus Pacebacteria bacterium]|nr:hypothetical protein [Candidatus Paceibacterota bacterium]MDR3583216.1 hypothetical protein [Candidatus Paceibacterota bacterium]